ncbi:MAG: chloride channel protein [Bacteroidota bacterium]
MFKRIRVISKLAFYRFIKNRSRYINDKNFLIVASLLVGITAGLAAVVLKYLVHTIHDFCESGFDVKYANYLYLIFPLIGILLSVLYLRLFHYKKVFDKGLSSIIYAISKKGSFIELHKTYSHIITSALTTGFGGSVGLEAPIAVTGSAIGSNAGKDLLVSKPERTLLLASGAAAGIAAIFNSPIAGVIFAFEVLLTEVTIPAFIPLLMASAAGAVISRLFHSENLFNLVTDGWRIHSIPYYTLLAILCGLLSVYMMRMTIKIEGWFKPIKNLFPKAILGGVIISLIIFIFPPLYGEGYEVINKLIVGDHGSLFDRSLFYDYRNNSWFIIGFAICILFIKVFAASVTIGAGGNGGIFGPSLFVGALLGFIFVKTLTVLGIADLRMQNFVAVAMCGLISGVLHAPLTAIFLIAEITGGYALIVPLMLVSSGSYFITRYFEKYSIYTKSLIERGFITFDKDKDLLSRVRLDKIIERDFVQLRPEQTLRELVNEITHCRRNIFAVVDNSKMLRGIITLDDIREIMFRHEEYDKVKVKKLMTIPRVTAQLTDDVNALMSKFDEYNVWNIPVVDEQGRYLGFVSKTGVLNQYREKLITEEVL